MINPFARLYFAIAVLVAGTVIGYYIAIGDRAGGMLLFFVSVAATLAGAVVVGPWVADDSPWVPADAPAPEQVVVGPSASPKASNWPIVAAAAVGILAIGLTVGGPMVVVGFIGGLIAAGGWLGQAFREDPAYSPRASARVWERVVGPLGVPLAAIALTAFIVVCVSRVLLAVNKDAAVAIALGLAVIVLLAFWFVASRPRSSKTMLGMLGGFAVVSLGASGIVGASTGERKFEPHEVPANVISLTAKNTQFSKSEIKASAGEAVTIVFHNDDANIFHNVAIYTAPKGGRPVAAGQPIVGVDKKTYTFDLDAGTYAFRCDFHANMVGTLNVQ